MDEGSAESPSPASASPERNVVSGSTRPFRRTKHAPFGFMHPTHLEDAGAVPHTITWHSRASRKHRYVAKPTKVHPHDVIRGGVRNVVAAGKEVQREIQLRVQHRYSRLKPDLAWDISFWVALSFVLGSAAWIINGFFLFLPLLNESSQQPTQAAAWGFVGGTAFDLGAFLMFVESLNTGHEELFKKALIGIWSEDPETREEKSRFRWYGLASLRDIGFLASVIQLFSATIFWVSTLTGLPGVIPGFPSNSSISITDIFFWTPQVIGGSGFIIASTLFMVECQKAWWKLDPLSLGWHIGFWNLVGSVGFTLCGALGYGAIGHPWMNYQSILATFWGSWSFMIGSVLQLWESVWREDGAGNDKQ